MGLRHWSTEELAQSMWEEILEGKGLPLNTPYVFRNDYGKVQRNEALCDYMWRKAYVQKGWPIGPSLIDSANESNSEPSDDDDDQFYDDFGGGKFDDDHYQNKKKKKKKIVIEATPKQNRHIRFRYESDSDADDESENSNKMSTDTTSTITLSSVSSNESHPPVCLPNRHIRFRFESDDEYDGDDESQKKKIKISAAD